MAKMHSVSPNANIAVVDAVGAMPNEQASSTLPILSANVLRLPRSLSGFDVIEITGTRPG